MNALDKRLLHDFYQVLDMGQTPEGRYHATLSINPQHPIFAGHFPGVPVVPGVCMLQITKEMLERVCGRITRLTEARNIKFMSILNPNENNTVRIELIYRSDENGQLLVESALLDTGSTKVFFKMKGTFL